MVNTHAHTLQIGLEWAISARNQGGKAKEVEAEDEEEEEEDEEEEENKLPVRGALREKI